MQENFEIIAVGRDEKGTGASRRLRHAGMVPGIIYGGGQAPEMFSTEHNTLIQHLDHEAFYSHILTVNLDGVKQRVVLKDLQRHPSKPFIQHMDLLRVAETDRIKMHVPLHFINEDTAPGVKAGGKVSHMMGNVEVICAAKDLPEFIEVDIQALQLGDTIHLSDLKLPENVEILALTHGADHDTGVVAIHAPKGTAETDEDEAESENEAS